MPENYFNHSMAPTVRIEYPEVHNVTVGVDPGYKSIFERNTWWDNKNYQIVGLGEDLQYNGGLIEFDSELVQANLNLTSNVVEYNTFIGPSGGLIYVNGGHVDAQLNVFSYNG